MTKYEILYIVMPLIVAALGWVAVLAHEWSLRREYAAEAAARDRADSPAP